MEGKNALFEKIYEIVSRIPSGKVATYGQVAFMAGRPNAARAVGYALRRSPPRLPCHRVVNRLGGLAPEEVFGGQGLQRHMLSEEGIFFKENGHIDLERHLWRPELE